jgi:hypothetical protein
MAELGCQSKKRSNAERPCDSRDSMILLAREIDMDDDAHPAVELPKPDSTSEPEISGNSSA